MIEVYADMVFAINFIMDFLIFWAVSKLIKKNSGFAKLFFGAFISTALFCAVLFAFVRFYNLPVMLLILSVGIVISFAPKSVFEFIKILVAANLVSFCIGGMGMALFYFTNISALLINAAGVYIENFSIKILLIVSSATYVAIKLFGARAKKILLSKKKLLEVKIFANGSAGVLNALLDTGNSLCDPLSASPVIIAEFERVKDFLPGELKTAFAERREHDLRFFSNFSSIQEIEENQESEINTDKKDKKDMKDKKDNQNKKIKEESDFSKRVRVIPYESVGKQNGILIGFRPDKVEISEGNKKIVINDVVIGIYNFKLSKDDSYQGLLNPDLMPTNF
jgi:stage II sporulation protein GA (sporulation sigma-E factor processing peptidase)